MKFQITKNVIKKLLNLNEEFNSPMFSGGSTINLQRRNVYGSDGVSPNAYVIDDNNEEYKTTEPEQEIDQDGFKLASCVLIISKDKRILGVSRKDDTSMWGMPGGKVDKGETPKAAAQRELKEETGLNCSDLKLVFVSVEYETKVYTYYGNIEGQVFTEEEGKIAWLDPYLLVQDSTTPFVSYNKKLFKKINLTV